MSLRGALVNHTAQSDGVASWPTIQGATWWTVCPTRGGVCWDAISGTFDGSFSSEP